MLNLTPKARVGIINLVDEEATHTHIGTTVFNNFEKKYPVDWGFPQKLEKELITQIKKSTNLDVVKIQPTETLISNEINIVQSKFKFYINPDLLPEIAKIKDQNKVDVLLIIRDIQGEDYFEGTGQYLKNYGLYTRSFLMIKSAHAYAYTKIEGIHGNPPKYIGGAFFLEHPKIKGFKFPSDIEQLDIEQLNNLGHYITDQIPEFIKNALIQMGLKTTKDETM